MTRREQQLRKEVRWAEESQRLAYLQRRPADELRAAFNWVERTRAALARYLDPATVSYD